MVHGSECLTDTLVSWKPTSSSRRISRSADSTIASGVGPPNSSRIASSSEPPLTPMRMATPASSANLPSRATLSCFLMLPGLIRTPAQPASIAMTAYFHWKWMSAITGMRACSAM